MAMMTIDGTEYEIDSLSDEAKGQIQNIQFVDSEVQRLHAQLAVFQTARIAYANALNEALAKEGK